MLIPYRIETERLVIRCWSPEDAEAYRRAIEASLEHLKRYMLWAKREPFDDTVTRLRALRAKFDLGEDFVMGIFDRDGEVVGGTGLHPRVGPVGIEIGYWVHGDWVRRGVATETAGVLTRVAFECAKKRVVEIRCAHNNLASAAVPRKLGFEHEATLPRRLEVSDGSFEDSLIFAMHADQYPSSKARTFRLKAFDAAGRVVLEH